MRLTLRCLRPFSISLLACAVATPSFSQNVLEEPLGMDVAYSLDTGALDNAGGTASLAYSTSITLPGADWLRLHFETADLEYGSYLLVTSTRDAQTHRLDAAAMDNWQNSTAYLNGDTLDLQLFAGPRSRGNRVTIKTLEAGYRRPSTRGADGQCGVCGADERTPSAENWVGRTMPVACTGSIICEDSTMISAGHCAGNGQVIQFNLPPNASPGCGTVNPPIADQFPVTLMNSSNQGPGNDWSIYKCGTNNLGQHPYERYGQLRRPAAAIPPVGTATEVVGYGVDLTCALTQTQQRSPGSLMAWDNGIIRYTNDMRPGNSGSPCTANGYVIGIVTHCSYTCINNIGTNITHPFLAAALNAVMSCDDSLAISFSAQGASPAITISPADTTGNTGGALPFLRTYPPGTAIAATAPLGDSAMCFHGWRLNDIDRGPNPILALVVNAPGAARAVYSPFCCPADRDDGTGTGWPDGGIDISDLLYFLNQFAVGSIAADLDNGSNTGTSDGGVDINDLLFFLTRFESGC